MTLTAHVGTRPRASWLLGLAWLVNAACGASHDGQSAPDDYASTHAVQPDAAVTPSDTDRFHPTLAGDTIYVDVTGPELWSLRTSCGRSLGAVRFEKVGDDPRGAPHPGLPNPLQGYYLDARFMPAVPPPATPIDDFGCDTSCVGLGSRFEVGSALEVVKTGQMAPPADAKGSPTLVDVFETRAISGSLRITIRYYTDQKCAETRYAVIEFDIPKGVCCPIGNTGCDSAGPAGGWAPDLEACKAVTWIGAPEVIAKPDLHGCPALVGTQADCCGCSDDDAGR